MVATLAVCTVEEQRAIIRFLWLEGVKPREVHRRMLQQYGDACIGERRVYEWVDAFKNGRTSIHDDHDNARPHMAAATLDTIRRLRFQILQHPPYSSDLAPSDYHVVGPLKDALRGRRFGNDDEVEEAVHSWLKAQPKTFFSDGIKKLVQRCEKSIENKGDYVEK
ncbi:histone-lysine N-methyltransferase SETMAR-like [Zootermopsis nevadensis]|uniref:histone-lysine N-methyltransferase SETMAR-like n=1 Tax=Zootermopsis nevadensis TaxID=136037 RepID=UPI000B8EB985|nr:histone-lysine N-methyltransferase SETMAR-like [Zootermopsis nevadensis]